MIIFAVIIIVMIIIITIPTKKRDNWPFLYLEFSECVFVYVLVLFCIKTKEKKIKRSLISFSTFLTRSVEFIFK